MSAVKSSEMDSMIRTGERVHLHPSSRLVHREPSRWRVSEARLASQRSASEPREGLVLPRAGVGGGTDRALGASGDIAGTARRSLRRSARRARMAWRRVVQSIDGDGRPIDPDALGRVFRAARPRAGLPGHAAHAPALGSDDADRAGERTSASWPTCFGRSAISFTLANYVHPDEDAAAEIAEPVGPGACMARIWGESFPHVATHRAPSSGTKPQVTGYGGRRRKG